MNEHYIHRLMCCGFSPHEAYKTYYHFLKEFSLGDLIKFIESIERDKHVCAV